MTISSEAMRVSYVGDGETTTFDFDFTINSADDVEVMLFTASDKEYSSTLSSGYTMTPNSTYPSAGGTITYPSSGTDYLSDDYYIVIQRSMEVIQDTSFAYGTTLSPTKIETALDTLTMQMQEVSDKSNRSLKTTNLDYSDLDLNIPAPEAGTALGWNDDADGFENIDVASSATSAAASATAAAASATSAASSATAAAASATEASGYVDDIGDSVDEAETYASNASTSATAAAASATLAASYATEAEGAAENAEDYANQAATSILVDAYDDSTTYYYPTVVAYTDGYNYRCTSTDGVTGEDPDDSTNWVRLYANTDDFFELDDNSDLMPTSDPTYSDQFTLDGNGDIMPKSS